MARVKLSMRSWLVVLPYIYRMNKMLLNNINYIQMNVGKRF